MRRTLLSICGFLLLVSTAVSAQEPLKSLKNISSELVSIRQDIDALHTEITFEKESFRDQMRSYANQKSDLDVKISRAELNNKELERELNKLAEANRLKSQAQDQVAPVVRQAIAVLQDELRDSLPFKLKERQQALDEIRSRLDTSIISPNKAANQLWAFVEDELMIGRSSGIYTDTLIVDGQEKLVKVLRIGKIAMFYQTNDGGYGAIRKADGQWSQTAVTSADAITQLDHLFDSFNKNLRNGEFTIPNIISGS